MTHPTPPPKPICPACGSDDVQALIGLNHQCRDCGHWFTVVNGQTRDMDDDEDTDPAA